MSFTEWIAIVLAIALAAYLFFALLRPESLE